MIILEKKRGITATLRTTPLALFLVVTATSVALFLSATAFQIDPTFGFVSSQEVAGPPTSNGPALRVGRSAPDFELEDANGTTIRLSEVSASGPIWITFWATWCGPCRAEAPDTEAVVRKGADQDWNYLAINVGENREIVRDFIGQYTFGSLLDPTRMVSGAYGVRMLPTHVFLNSEGLIDEIQPGILNRLQMESRIERLLEQAAK